MRPIRLSKRLRRDRFGGKRKKRLCLRTLRTAADSRKRADKSKPKPYEEVPGTSAQSSANLTLDDVVFGNGKFLAVGVWGAVLTSSDGLEWLYHPPHASENNLNALAFGADAFVAVGGLGDSTGLS